MQVSFNILKSVNAPLPINRIKNNIYHHIVTRQGLGQKQICLRPIGSEWILEFMQERFYNTNLGDFEKTFIEAEDNETKKGLQKQTRRHTKHVFIVVQVQVSPFNILTILQY